MVRMNEYRYEDLQIGMSESFSVEIREDMLSRFLSITDDFNPLHNDEVFAREKGFAGKVVYGMLTMSFMSTLGGVLSSGKILSHPFGGGGVCWPGLCG